MLVAKKKKKGRSTEYLGQEEVGMQRLCVCHGVQSRSKSRLACWFKDPGGKKKKAKKVRGWFIRNV